MCEYEENKTNLHEQDSSDTATVPLHSTKTMYVKYVFLHGFFSSLWANINEC